MIGQTIGHYTILSKLGEGGMGVVYKAHDTRLDRTVALKFLPQHLTARDTERARLLQEARAASALNHPNICGIHTIGEFEDQQFIDLEYIDGETLGEKIKRGPIPLSDAVAYAIQIGEALHEAHANGIVHRDIKSENVMVNSRNQIKVMDFGLAKLKGSAKLTRTSSTIGTLAYMSPEQIQGSDGDARSDIFSFGVLFFEMLTAQLPFRGAHEASMVYSIVNEEPDSITKYLPSASAEIAHILDKALDKDPQARYQNVTDMVVDLRRLKKDSTRVHRTAPIPDLPAGTTAKGAGNAPASGRPSGRRKLSLILGIPILAVAGVLALIFHPWKSSGDASDRKTLVVLPFENQGDPDKGYFADGLTDEITSRLSGLSNLSVIARSSAKGYKNTTKTLKQIGEELGVDYVLMGTIRWSGSSPEEQRIRVNPELIQVNNRFQVWSQPFEVKFSDAFSIQSNIASEVARALDVKLLQPEQQALAKKLTENSVAYDYYLKGLEYEDRGFSREFCELSVRLFQQSVTADPKFAAAYAALSRTHSNMYWFFYDRTEERLQKAKEAADRALELEPTLAVAVAAKGWYYYHGRLELDRAIEQFNLSLKYQPNNDDAYYGLATAERRQGKMREAIQAFENALAISPRSVEMTRQLGETHMLLREYQIADSIFDRLLLLAPDNMASWYSKVLNTFIGTADLSKVRLLMEQGRTRGHSESHEFALFSFMISYFEGSYDRAMEAVSKAGETNTQFVFIPPALRRATVETFLGNPAKARPFFNEARIDLEQRVASHPEDERYHSALGIACAGLGRKEDAIKEAERGVALLPVGKDAWRGTHRLTDLAQVYMMVGEQEKAVDLLERLLSIPSEISKPVLRRDPTWKALEGNKRFRSLVAG
jgi:eukaryotic-like serine/threonine-protein kinase